VSETLHITNGDIAADLLRRSHVSGDILPWRDPLHEGPVEAGLPLEELSRRRAAFMGEAGWTSATDAQRMFDARAEALALPDREEVVLWFEHDLYDQLQLLQVIDSFADRLPSKFTLVEIGEFPGISKFLGLGQLSPSQLSSLFPSRRPITPDIVALARSAWGAFRSPDPSDLKAILRAETFSLPFLQDAVIRHLEEFPSVENGLGRTERQLLGAALNDRTLLHLFNANQRLEERAYMTDSILKWRLRLLAGGRAPLLTGRSRRLGFDVADAAFWSQEVVLTPAGQAVVDGKEDAVRLGGIDRWFGGVLLSGPRPVWRWSQREKRLVARTADGN